MMPPLTGENPLERYKELQGVSLGLLFSGKPV